MAPIDIIAYGVAVRYCLHHPTEGVDTLTAAARRVSGDESLVLTPEERHACKIVAHGALYGAGPEAMLRFLRSRPTPLAPAAPVGRDGKPIRPDPHYRKLEKRGRRW